MGRSSYRHVILSAVAVYTFLALATDIFDQKEPKKDVFKLEKLVSILCDFLYNFLLLFFCYVWFFDPFIACDLRPKVC